MTRLTQNSSRLLFSVAIRNVMLALFLVSEPASRSLKARDM